MRWLLVKDLQILRRSPLLVGMLIVYPIAIGGGLRIFPEDRGRLEFELADLVRYDSGAVLQVYRRTPTDHS